MAVLLVAVAGVGLWWYVLVTRVNDQGDLHLGEACNGGAAGESFRTYTDFSMIAADPALREADEAFHRLTRSRRWQIDVTSDDGAAPVHVTMVRDGDTVEFRRDDGTVGRLVPGGALVRTGPDSSFWLATCHDPSLVLFSPGRGAGCVQRHRSGADLVLRYRAAGSKPPDCAATINIIDFEVVVRDGRLARWSYDVTTSSGVSHDEWEVTTPEDLDEPSPWQIVPEWFVGLVG